MTERPAIARVLLTGALCFGAQAAIYACPVCFQIEDAHVASGIHAAVGVLMGVTVAVLAPTVVFAVRCVRRSASVPEPPAPRNLGTPEPT